MEKRISIMFDSCREVYNKSLLRYAIILKTISIGANFPAKKPNSKTEKGLLLPKDYCFQISG